MKGWILLLALTLGVAFVASEIWIPAGLESALKGAILQNVEKVGTLDVRIKNLPAAGVLAGRIAGIDIDASDLVVSGFNVSRVVFTARGLKFDPVEMITKHKLDLKSVDAGEVTLILTEADINRFFRSQNGIMKALSLELDPGNARLEGEVTILGAELSLAVNGKFVIEEGKVIRYEPTELLVLDFRVPDLIRKQIFRGLNLSVNLGELPFPMGLREIKVEDEKIYVLGGTP